MNGLARVPPRDGDERAAAGSGSAGGAGTQSDGAIGPAEVTRRLVEDHDRIASGLNDVVVRRLFAAGLDLQTALGLTRDQHAAGKICHAIGEIDQAIRDIRDNIFDRDMRDQPSPTAT